MNYKTCIKLDFINNVHKKWFIDFGKSILDNNDVIKGGHTL